MHKSFFNIFFAIGKGIDSISRYSSYVSIVLLMVMTFSIGYEVIARKFFQSPTVWVYPLTQFAFMWFILFAGAYTFCQEGHVRCDLLVNHLPRNIKELMLAVADLASVIFLLALLYTGSLKVLKEYLLSGNEVGIITYPSWILFLSIPMGIALCVLQVTRNIAKRFYGLNKKTLFGSGLFLFKAISVPSIFVILCLFGAYILHLSPGLGIVCLVIIFILSGAPVGVSLGTIACIAIFFIHEGDVSKLSMLPLVVSQVFGSFVLLAIPLYVWGGYILAEGGLGERLYDFVGKWLNFLPGNLGIATAITGGILAAMVGSSTAVTSIIVVVAAKPLLEANYGKSLTYGTIAGTSLGTVIPPSIGFIVYGYLTNTSVGELFMAGFIPGVLLVGLFSVFIMIVCLLTGKGHTAHFSWKERFISLRRASYILSIPIFALGGIYLGIMTPTEAAAILVLLSIFGLVIYHKLSWNTLKETSKKACLASNMILFIILGAVAIAHVLAYLRIPRHIAEFVLSANQPVWVIIIALLIMYIVLGMFLEGASITALTIPVIAPMLSVLDIDLVSFGVILVLLIEIALLTPPVGLNLFVVKGISNESLSLIVNATIPFLFIILLVTILVFFFPQLALWLPSLMGS